MNIIIKDNICNPRTIAHLGVHHQTNSALFTWAYRYDIDKPIIGVTLYPSGQILLTGPHIGGIVRSIKLTPDAMPHDAREAGRLAIDRVQEILQPVINTIFNP